MLNKANNWVVIPAAGVGARMQANKPKQYLYLHGKTVLEHTLAIFLEHPQITGVVVVISASDEYWQDLKLSHSKLYVCQGGRERADSVLNGLNYLSKQLQVASDAWVLVHDAARPCLSCTDLDKLLDSQIQVAEQGALLAMPVRDTMKRAQPDSQQIAFTENREGLWHALTPQMAKLQVLQRALADALKQEAIITDEASALEWVGLNPFLIEGDARNIKITRPADLALAAFFLLA
jgi:2-C-methyl-D-erythritol 4-phosphate cytidylyltransferase